MVGSRIFNLSLGCKELFLWLESIRISLLEKAKGFTLGRLPRWYFIIEFMKLQFSNLQVLLKEIKNERKREHNPAKTF